MNEIDHAVSDWLLGNHGIEYQARVSERQGKFTCCLDARYASTGQWAGITAGDIKDSLEDAKKTVLGWLAERTGKK